MVQYSGSILKLNKQCLGPDELGFKKAEQCFLENIIVGFNNIIGNIPRPRLVESSIVGPP